MACFIFDGELARFLEMALIMIIGDRASAVEINVLHNVIIGIADLCL